MILTGSINYQLIPYWGLADNSWGWNSASTEKRGSWKFGVKGRTVEGEWGGKKRFWGQDREEKTNFRIWMTISQKWILLKFGFLFTTLVSLWWKHIAYVKIWWHSNWKCAVKPDELFDLGQSGDCFVPSFLQEKTEVLIAFLQVYEEPVTWELAWHIAVVHPVLVPLPMPLEVRVISVYWQQCHLWWAKVNFDYLGYLHSFLSHPWITFLCLGILCPVNLCFPQSRRNSLSQGPVVAGARYVTRLSASAWSSFSREGWSSCHTVSVLLGEAAVPGFLVAAS